MRVHLSPIGAACRDRRAKVDQDDASGCCGCGVSAKTVSWVLRNDRYVEGVRLRVERAVAELQYVPNTLARTFRSGSHNAIGGPSPTSRSVLRGAYHGVETVARARGSAVIVTSLGDDDAGERPGLEALLGRRLAGLIATPISRDQSYLNPWLSRTPVVFVDRPRGESERTA